MIDNGNQPTEAAAPDMAATHAPKAFWQRLLPLGLIIIAIAVVYLTGTHEYLSFEALAENREELAEFVSENKILAVTIYMALYAIAVALSLPGGAVLTITGGFLFGLVVGTISTVISATPRWCLIAATPLRTARARLRRRTAPAPRPVATTRR